MVLLQYIKIIEVIYSRVNIKMYINNNFRAIEKFQETKENLFFTTEEG